MKWKKFFKLCNYRILHCTNVNLAEFKKMLDIVQECISTKNLEKYNSQFMILKNIDTKQLPLTKFLAKVKSNEYKCKE